MLKAGFQEIYFALFHYLLRFIAWHDLITVGYLSTIFVLGDGNLTMQVEIQNLGEYQGINQRGAMLKLRIDLCTNYGFYLQ